MIEEAIDDVTGSLSGVGDQLRALGIGVVQLAVAVLLASIIARWLRRRLRARLDSLPSPSLAVLAENGVSIAVYVTAGTILLALWGLTWSNLVTVLGISTVAVAFGFQDFLRSIVGGILVVAEKPFAPGDRIKIRDIDGRVESISIRTTLISTEDGDRVVIPNALIFSDPIVNKSPNRKRMTLTVSGLDQDPAGLRERVIKILTVMDGSRRPEVQVRTKRPHVKVADAIDALPGIELERPAGARRTRAIGFTVRWYGDGGKAELERVKDALQSEFPGARVGAGAWY